jgi:epoxyqueuosine reductase
MHPSEEPKAIPRTPLSDDELADLAAQIKIWSRELGFQLAGIAGVELGKDETHLLNWLAQQRHGEMAYMRRHGIKRSRPQALAPGTLCIVSLRMDYWPAAAPAEEVLQNPDLGYISRYTLGRDYHKLIRTRLRTLARRIEGRIGPFGYRAFVDSAPVLEKALARNAGLGWIGKHTNLIQRDAGSWFFLGELYTDLPLPPDPPHLTQHCGSCSACIEVCPTQAIVAPWQLDARRCISYLTIELRGAIPEEFRPLIGNRVYGCDDCQLVCPWNRFARLSVEKDFAPRHGLDAPALLSLFQWSEAEFLSYTEGSAIRRIGYVCWLRNIAVALGNAPTSQAVVSALAARRDHPSELVREHVSWALKRHGVE